MRFLRSFAEILSEKTFHEFFMIARFGMVGLIATVVHLFAASFFFMVLGLNELLSNLMAFFIAFPVSFLGHKYFTFRVSGSSTKFFAVSASAFFLNNLLLIAFIEFTSLKGVYAIGFALILMPLIVFLFSRYWVFQND